MLKNKKLIVHIITSTTTGGAEIALYNFLANSNFSAFNHCVISLAPIGNVGERISRLGINVFSLNLRAKNRDILSIFKVLNLFKILNADFVHCWMYHANVLGGLAARMAGLPVFWSVHHDQLNPALLKRRTILIAKLSGFLSRIIPNLIIFCSKSSLNEHIRLGYDLNKSTVISNGFDTQEFVPDDMKKSLFRKRNGIPENAVIVGRIGRFDPTKDYHSLLVAAGIATKSFENVYFLLCGDQINWENKTVFNWVDDAGIKERTLLLGQCDDMPYIYAALDINVSSSLSESFPNVIGEAMSCGVPCVVTDVGDSSILVGDTGIVVPPGDSEKLANAIEGLIGDEEKRISCGKAARQRICKYYSIQSMVNHYEGLYSQYL